MSVSIPVPHAVERLWQRVPPGRRLPLGVAAVCELVLLLWWAAFFPGMMSYDSISYTWQVTTDHWLGTHSVLYNSLVWLSLQICGDFWLLTLVQTVAYAAALGYACAGLRDLGVPGRWSAPFAVALTLLPATGTLPVFVWKDSAFGVSALFAFGAVLRLTARRLNGRQLVRDAGYYRQLALLTAGFLGIALFRNNSVLVLVFAWVPLVWGLRGMRSWITGATVLACAVWALLQGVVYPAVGVVRPTADQTYAINYADLAYVYSKAPQTFTTADKAVMAQVAPLSFWRGPGADCYSADATVVNSTFDRATARRLNSQLQHIWWETIRRTPQYWTEVHLCRSSIAWAVFNPEPTGSAVVHIANPTIPADLFGWKSFSRDIRHSPYLPVLRTRPLLPGLHSPAQWWYTLSRTEQLNWLFWRGALACYVVYGVVVVWIWRRREWGSVALAGVTVGLQCSVIAANPSQLARYMIPVMYLGALTLPLLPVAVRPRRDAPGPLREPGGAVASPPMPTRPSRAA